MHKKLLLFLYSLVMVVLAAPSVWAEMSGRDIMERVDAMDSSKDSVRTSVMVIERGSTKLVRRMENMSKKYGENDEDTRTLVRFSEPADVRGTTYLTWAYDDSAQEDDMWLYLPAESLVRRISGGGKKGAFMRSDLANEDIESRAVDDDIHKLIARKELAGTNCYVIESIPRPELKKDTNYSKRIQYIRSDIYLPARVEFYDKRGKLIKTATFGGYKQIEGIWTITKVIYETPRRKTRTLLQHTDVTYNQGLEDNLFLQSNLTR